MDEKIPCEPASGPGTVRTAAKKTWTVPAGTKVLLETRSSVNTKTAQAGDGVYLSTVFPVVSGNRVAIPAGVYVQGVVDRVERAGRVKGRAQLDLLFTTLIFPNGTLVDVPGVVSGLPGGERQTVKDNGEGTVEASGGKGKNAGKVAEIGIPTGGTVGSIAGAAAGHPLAGGLGGMGAGLAAAGIVSLFTRGADVNIPRGAQVEMVLQRPLVLQEENLAGVAPGSPALVPAPDQPRPITPHNRPRVLCPPGGLGCYQVPGSD
jgi:type IV secretion system protein VirB10